MTLGLFLWAIFIMVLFMGEWGIIILVGCLILGAIFALLGIK